MKGSRFVTERPILMSAPMVRATLRDVDPKTQTRRVLKPQPKTVHEGKPYWHVGGLRTSWIGRSADSEPHWGNNPLLCPYGVGGSRLWVREAFCIGYEHEPGHFTAIPYSGCEAVDLYAPLGLAHHA